MDLATEAQRRHTFAIISHPDAGKTTLTEKLLLYGGALHQAGAVKARKAARHAVSDWMEMEKEKGISITSSVLQFDHEERRFNLLDTPGHADFSEDTYRTLAAVDSAVMLLDNAKGVEARTLKLFEVCRMRKLPVMTFVNKMDRPGLDPLDLMDQVAKTLDIATVPLNWPVRSDDGTFIGVVDRRGQQVILYDRQLTGTEVVPQQVLPLDNPKVKELVGETAYDELMEELRHKNRELQESFENLKRTTSAKERMESELNIGRDIQMSMLPVDFDAYAHRHEFRLFATLHPAREVGGDFYDFFLIDEDRLCVCVGDVSRKGVPAALFMAMTKTLIKSR